MDPERMKIAGNAVADTDMLRFLAGDAILHEFEHQLPPDLLERLDPDGKHLLCIRPELMPDADLSGINAEGTGFSKLDITFGTPLPCLVMMKLKGQHAAVERMLSVKVIQYMKLEQVWGPSKQGIILTVEGQRRQRARWN
jgi:hypothetical protein